MFLPIKKVYASVFDDIFGSLGPNFVITDTTRFGSISSISGLLINFFIGVGFSISIVSITYSVILHVMSEGDPDKTKTAWNAFIWGVIAAAISLGALALKNMVTSALGIDNVHITNDVPSF